MVATGVTATAKGIFAASVLVLVAACSNQSSNNSLPNQDGNSLQTDHVNAIIGGEEISASTPIAKSIVAVYDAAEGQLCSGALLTNNIVVTAAHCIGEDPTSMYVFFDVKVSENSEKRQVVQTVVSPLWATRQNEDKDHGDIALVKFEGSLPATYSAAVVLPNFRLLKNGGSVTLTGYGLSNAADLETAGTLRQVDVQIADTAFARTEITIDQTHGKGACHGDSGGPAYVNINGKNYVWGITSRGVQDDKNDCSKLSAYTSLAAYRTWINQTTARLRN